MSTSCCVCAVRQSLQTNISMSWRNSCPKRSRGMKSSVSGISGKCKKRSSSDEPQARHFCKVVTLEIMKQPRLDSLASYEDIRKYAANDKEKMRLRSTT